MLKLIKSLFTAKSGSSSGIYDMPAHKGFRVEVYFTRTYRTSHLIRATLAGMVIVRIRNLETGKLAPLDVVTREARRAERRNAKRYAAALTAAYGRYAD